MNESQNGSSPRSDPLTTRLKNFPVSFFSVVMGLSGFVIATQKMEEMIEITDVPSTVLLVLTLLVFLILAVVYALKLIRHRADCAREFADPVKLSFFPAFSIGLLLVSIAFLPISKTASFVFWVVGTVVHLVLTLAILTIWVQQQKFEIKHMSPVWFIPVVGNILVPIAGVEHAPREISWFFFSVGLMFWAILQTLFFYRIFFHHPLPEKLLPTLFILLAPPAVGFVAYAKLTGGVDHFSFVLYYFALFLFLFLLVQTPMLRRARFFLSWWAYSFPVAALAIATTAMYRWTAVGFFPVLAWIVFALLIGIICMLAVLTVRAVARSEICVDE